MSTLAQLKAGKLVGIQRLTLACGLTEFPPEIFELADSLEILDLSNNRLSALPDDLPRLHKLRILFCSNNAFTELPSVLGRCKALNMVGFKANAIRHVSGEALSPALRWLILTDNQIETLPPEIGRCTRLQKCMLAGNRLTTLPPDMANCTGLELLRLSANCLTELPAFLLSLPKLSWLAYAGNPFFESEGAPVLHRDAMPNMAWQNLQIQHQLGEGASGVIHQALWQNGADTQTVAVKIFKGEVTSDGLPHCEIAACSQAGTHPHLIPILGQVQNHPSGAMGMVMALIDPVFVNLAGPPSLDSCTRDSYPTNTRLDWHTTIQLLLGMASAARHLHAQGLMHGDFYAHNILHNGAGKALLGDFGAASFLALKNVPQTLALQRLEVRAFGCLLEELLARSPPEAEPITRQSLTDLLSACVDDNTSARPLFSEIERALQKLA
jgi:hypothetical protein